MNFRKFIFRTYRVVNFNYSFQKLINNRLYVIVIHQVNNNNNLFYPAVPINVFHDLCIYLIKNFNIINLSDIENYFSKDRKPAFIITFDDGHYDFLENALPIIKKYNIKCNMNINTESLETGLPQDNVRAYDVLNSTCKTEYINKNLFRDLNIQIKIDKNNLVQTEIEFVRLFQALSKKQRRLVADDIVAKLASKSVQYTKMLSKEDLIYIFKEGVKIGSHTHSHPILTNCNDEEIEFELKHSKNILENMLNSEIDIIAYPDGRHNDRIIQKSMQAGYKYFLLTGENKNIVNNKSCAKYNRIGLYYNTTEESLAKIFGLHQTIFKLKTFMSFYENTKNENKLYNTKI